MNPLAQLCIVVKEILLISYTQEDFLPIASCDLAYSSYLNIILNIPCVAMNKAPHVSSTGTSVMEFGSPMHIDGLDGPASKGTVVGVPAGTL